MARGLLFGALAAALLLASAHARALKHQPPNTCQYLPNTYLTTGLYLNRYAGVSTADACCQLCQSEFGGCGLFTWCPADATEGCFTGGTGGFLETAGACTLYSTASGWTPTLNQQGPQTKWISGAPPNATLPDVPQAKPGVCAPHNNTMLAGTYIQGTTEPTVDACCDRCSNNPDCAAWSYCPAGPGLSCVILSGKQDGQTCNLYSLQPGQKADVVQQGPETTWISGYRDPEGQYPVPDVTATAPEGCNFVENTMLTSKEPWLGGWYNVADADTCCTLCRNTPTCGVWAYCPLLGGQPCVTSYGQESPASCLVYPAADPSSIYVDQRSNETTWISGLKYIKEYEIPA